MTSPQVQPIQTQPLEVSDFSGGITDYYVGAAGNRYETADNLLIVKYGSVGKLFTRPGSEILDADNFQIPPGAQRIGLLLNFTHQLSSGPLDTLYYSSAGQFFYTSAIWFTLTGPTGNDVFPGATTTDVVSLTTGFNHIYAASSAYHRPVKIYRDESGVVQVRTAGLPVAGDASFSYTPGAANYLYTLVRKYTYSVADVLFIDRGPPNISQSVPSASPPDINQIDLSSIDALSNGSEYNYDTASTDLVTEIYRTTDGGINFYYVDEVANGTTTYSDTLSDADLLNNEPLYTEGGIPDNDPPPPCKFVHILAGRGFYANVLDLDNDLYAYNRYYQSIPGDIDSVPATFYSEVDDAISGFSSFRASPILMCESGKVYRVDGGYDELGGGSFDNQCISVTAGCVSNLSIVQTDQGIFWAGIDGFYYTDGFNVLRISDGLVDTYRQLVSSAAKKRRIVGKYDVLARRIYWTIQSSSNSTDCDSCYVLDLNYGISEDMPFTTLSGGESFAPTALEFIDGNLVRGGRRGYTFIHRDTLYSDPEIDLLSDPEDWEKSTIIYNYVSAATDFGTTFARKWVPSISVICKNETNLSLQIISINDDKKKYSNLKPIRYRGNLIWGADDVYWGDPDIAWNVQGIINEQRRFPAKGLRCQYKQVQLTNAYVAIVNSDTLGVVDVDNGASTATFSAGSVTWPSNLKGYNISFENDGFSRDYTILSNNDDTITFDDSMGFAPTKAGSKWVIRGTPKDEVMHLIQYTVEYAVFGKTELPFRSTATGEVRGS